MKDKKRQQVNFTIQLPRITVAGKRAAQEIANADFVIEVDGKPQSFLISELTDEMIRSVSDKFSAIPDGTERSTSLFRVVRSCLQMVAAAQKIASHYAQVADELEVVSKQLEAMQGVIVHGVKRKKNDN